MKDQYKTIQDESIGEFKDRGSKFVAYAYPAYDEATWQLRLEEVKKLHFKARHHCYAYRIGLDGNNFRANDDGEPNNSAGMPIYGQIQSFEVTDILVVVVRYFGGVKLGVGGLINAYRTGAQMALDASTIVTRTINVEFAISFDYKNMNKVMRIIKEKNISIINQTLELSCEIIISVRLKEANSIFEIFENLYEVDIKTLND